MSSDETTRLRALPERAEGGTWVSMEGAGLRKPDAALIVAAADITALLDRMERAERERDDLAATLETRNAEHALAVEQLAAVTAERDALRAERDGEHDLIARQAAILTAVADALKGTPPALMTHSHHDLGAVAAATVAQQAPLVACVDALRAAATAAGWRDADATGESLVAWVRRGAMRECLAIEAPKVRALRAAVNALCNVRTLRATCAEGETWRAHVHDKDWTDARANALAVLNATGGGS